MGRPQRYEPGWHDLTDIERSVKAVEKALDRFDRVLDGAEKRLPSYAGTKSFAPVATVTLGADAFRAGARAHLAVILKHVEVSKLHLDSEASDHATETGESDG